MGLCSHDTTFFFILSSLLIGSFIGTLLFQMAGDGADEDDITDDVTDLNDVIVDEHDPTESTEDVDDEITDDNIYDVVNDAVDDLFDKGRAIRSLADEGMESYKDEAKPIIKVVPSSSDRK